MKKYLIGFVCGLVVAMAANVGMAYMTGERGTGDTVASSSGRTKVEYCTYKDSSGAVTSYSFQMRSATKPDWVWRLEFKAEGGEIPALTRDNIGDIVHVADEGYVKVSFGGTTLQTAMKR